MSYSDVIQRRLCQNGYRLTLAMILLLAVGCQRMEEESKAVGPVSSIEAEENSAVGMEPEAQHLYNLEGQAPFLLAHYLPWFENDSAPDPARKWTHWKWSSENARHDPDQLRGDGLRDIAAAQYPLIGPYASNDSSVVEYHLRTARAAGIDGMIVLWYGPGSETDQKIAMILNEAEKAGMKIALCYEEKINWPNYRNPNSREVMVDTAAKDLIYLVNTYGSHPAYLLRKSKPVIFQFNYWGQDRLGTRTFNPQEWQQILGQLPQEVSYVRQNFKAKFYPTLAASYHWWTTDKKVLERYYNNVQQAMHSGDMEYHVGVIAPGFDDQAVDGWGHGRRFEPRNGTATLESSLQSAMTGKPELVQIVTWNDFNEGSEIEPTVEHGFAALDAIEQWWSQVKNCEVNLADNRIPLRDYLLSLNETQVAEIPQQAFSYPIKIDESKK